MGRVFLCSFCVFLWGAAACADSREPLRFGIVPQGSPSSVLTSWQPLVTFLAEALDHPIVAVTQTDIPTFEACVHQGAYDIAFMNPYHYAVFSRSTGYRAIAQRGDEALVGHLIVLADGPVRSIADLAGQEIAFPSPAAFAASILVRAQLDAEGIDYTPLYTRSQESGYLAVARGLLVATGGENRTFEAFRRGHPAYENLQVIQSTEAFAAHPIAVAPWISQSMADQIVTVLAEIHLAAPAVLEPLAIGHFTAASDADYGDVRALAIPEGQVGLNIEADPPCPFG